MTKRYLAGRTRNLLASAFESLERRAMLHDGGMTHIPASTFLLSRPELVGKDLWAPATFNPTNSLNRSDWLYDPHTVEDDITKPDSLYQAPSVSTGPEAGTIALPDLVPLNNASYLSPFIDTTEIPGHNLMRFSTAVANMGAGPVTLTSANSGTPPTGSGITTWINTDGTQNVLQQVYRYDGTSYSLNNYRPAGKMVWHNGHGHFHLEGYARYRLLTNVAGSPGPVAKRTGFDNSDAEGEKIGFCLINILSSFTIPGTSTSSNTLPGYNKPGQPSTSCGFLQGISTGYADVYDSIYDGQWIDVTGVPNGNYFLEVTLDAGNVIEESNETNNVVLRAVTLNASTASGGSILPDRFEPNNTVAAATNLGVLGVQNQPGLSSHISNEDDYFKFESASTGAGNVQLVITDRDVNLYLYDSALNLIGSSASATLGTVGAPSTETVSTNFVAGQTYYIRAAGFGSNQTSGGVSSNYTLKVNINPTINAATATATATEVGLTPGAFTVQRNGPTSSPLTVNFTVGGSATRGVDYVLQQDGVPITGNTLSIGNEASLATLQVIPLGDSLVEPNETVTITLGSGLYFLNGSTATVTINDTPPAAVAGAFGFETAHTVSFDFSLDVGASLQPGDLILTNLTTSTIVAATTAQYDSLTNRATFGFAGQLPNGNYEAKILQSSLTHSQGVQLAADALQTFFVLTGDVNRDRVVNFDDLLIVSQNFGTTGKTFSQGNVNYDAAGNVDFDDLLVIAQQYDTSIFSSVRVASASSAKSKQRRASDVLV